MCNWAPYLVFYHDAEFFLKMKLDCTGDDVVYLHNLSLITAEVIYNMIYPKIFLKEIMVLDPRHLETI